MRWLSIAHHLPERTRLRSPALRRDPEACERMADALAEVPGVREVRVRPYTGSVLIVHRGVAAAVLADAASRTLGGAQILANGASPPLIGTVPAFSTVREKVAAIAREIDRDIRRGSDGSVDLGTLATFGLAGAGVLEVAATGKLPAPPWFNLAWWAYRMFMTTNDLQDAPEAEPTRVAEASAGT